jgi:hypothetical protein
MAMIQVLYPLRSLALARSFILIGHIFEKRIGPFDATNASWVVSKESPISGSGQ